MRKLIVSILLITSLSNAGINECFENGRFNSNIGHDTLDCGNVDVVSWAMGVIEALWTEDNSKDLNAYQICAELYDADHADELETNACNALLGGK